MDTPSRLSQLRAQHFFLQNLPDAIHIPPLGARAEVPARPLEEASLDDVAFAIIALEGEQAALSELMLSLRKLYAFARKAGGLGCEKPVDLLLAGEPA